MEYGDSNFWGSVDRYADHRHLTFPGSRNTQKPQIWSETVFSIQKTQFLTLLEATVYSETPETSNACVQTQIWNCIYHKSDYSLIKVTMFAIQ